MRTIIIYLDKDQGEHFRHDVELDVEMQLRADRRECIDNAVESLWTYLKSEYDNDDCDGGDIYDRFDVIGAALYVNDPHDFTFYC